MATVNLFALHSKLKSAPCLADGSDSWHADFVSSIALLAPLSGLRPVPTDQIMLRFQFLCRGLSLQRLAELHHSLPVEGVLMLSPCLAELVSTALRHSMSHRLHR